MSWSASFTVPVLKADADRVIDFLTAHGDPPAQDQLAAAKRVAKVLLASVPGPWVSVQLSGHANGVGWQKKDGWANDCISVSVQQVCEDDLRYYAPQPNAAAVPASAAPPASVTAVLAV